VVGHHAITTPDFNLSDLCGQAGRLDVLVRAINSAFFISHGIRKNVELILVLLGGDRPPKTIRLVGAELKYLNPDERSTAGLLRNALAMTSTNLTGRGFQYNSSLYRGKQFDDERRATPGIYVSNSNFDTVISYSANNSTRLIYLHEAGEAIDLKDIANNVLTFILSDHKDLTSGEEKILDRYGAIRFQLGPVSMLTSHCITIVHNILDKILL
jgi:tRNA (pseudouridine54-N1)-methyltransferase